ncbi:two-component system, OmpR family, phosphate regulon response regulator OmpR [Sphingomonas sp. OV641]|uniref:response regulator n=1 Tax=Sphingomonas sp. OV641 TaxID=1881068 RepID=UPI0008C166BE|nr:response regulator [Sphingomonas sp. OV641]SEJ66945.1 two-component system, OmpR family, phosphate regulon response regulator OmpR [Sphingomonas sp. OV641]
MSEATPGAHIAVVDDEPDLREGVREYLADQGFAVSVAADGAALRALMAERAVDLVLLDVNMPGEDGLSIARYLRDRGGVAIIMLTANRDTVDRVVGLEVGADDYVPKPFDLRELLARIRAVLRRTAQAQAQTATLAHEVRIGRCLLNLDSHKLYDLQGEEVAITAMEFDLLRTFVEHPGRVLTRDRLLDLAHQAEMTPFDRSIDMRVARLRRKVELDPRFPQALKTVRGAGYIFVPAGATR